MVLKKSKCGLNSGNTIRTFRLRQIQNAYGRRNFLTISINKTKIYDDEQYVKDLIEYKVKVFVHYGMPYGSDEQSVRRNVEPQERITTKARKLQQLRNVVTEVTGAEWSDDDLCNKTALNLNKRNQWNLVDTLHNELATQHGIQSYTPWDAWDTRLYDNIMIVKEALQPEFKQFNSKSHFHQSPFNDGLHSKNQSRKKFLNRVRCLNISRGGYGNQRRIQSPAFYKYLSNLCNGKISGRKPWKKYYELSSLIDTAFDNSMKYLVQKEKKIPCYYDSSDSESDESDVSTEESTVTYQTNTEDLIQGEIPFKNSYCFNGRKCITGTFADFIPKPQMAIIAPERPEIMYEVLKSLPLTSSVKTQIKASEKKPPKLKKHKKILTELGIYTGSSRSRLYKKYTKIKMITQNQYRSQYIPPVRCYIPRTVAKSTEPEKKRRTRVEKKFHRSNTRKMEKPNVSSLQGDTNGGLLSETLDEAMKSYELQKEKNNGKLIIMCKKRKYRNKCLRKVELSGSISTPDAEIKRKNKSGARQQSSKTKNAQIQSVAQVIKHVDQPQLIFTMEKLLVSLFNAEFIKNTQVEFISNCDQNCVKRYPSWVLHKKSENSNHCVEFMDEISKLSIDKKLHDESTSQSKEDLETNALILNSRNGQKIPSKFVHSYRLEKVPTPPKTFPVDRNKSHPAKNRLYLNLKEAGIVQDDSKVINQPSQISKHESTKTAITTKTQDIDMNDSPSDSVFPVLPPISSPKAQDGLIPHLKTKKVNEPHLSLLRFQKLEEQRNKLNELNVSDILNKEIRKEQAVSKNPTHPDTLLTENGDVSDKHMQNDGEEALKNHAEAERTKDEQKHSVKFTEEVHLKDSNSEHDKGQTLLTQQPAEKPVRLTRKEKREIKKLKPKPDKKVRKKRKRLPKPRKWRGKGPPPPPPRVPAKFPPAPAVNPWTKRLQDFQNAQAKLDNLKNKQLDSKMNQGKLKENKQEIALWRKYSFNDICVKIKQSCLTMEYLKAKFSSKFQVGISIPRKIQLKLMFAEEIYLIIYIKNQEQSEALKDEYRLARLTLKTSSKGDIEEFWKIIEKDVKQHFIYPLSKIVSDIENQFQQFKASKKSGPLISPLPSLVLGSDSGNGTPNFNFEWLHTHCGWSIKIYAPDDAYTKISKLQNSESNKVLINDETIEEQTPESCIICKKSRFDDSTALCCGHWICHECWSLYLADQIKKQKPHLTCPVNNCNEAVDSVTLLYFVPLPVYRWHQLTVKQSSRKVTEWQWCPNQKCDRALNISSSGLTSVSKAVPVQCLCKGVWCFDCTKAPHWPASCTHAQLYNAILQQYGAILDQVSKSAITLYTHDNHGGASTLKICSDCILLYNNCSISNQSNSRFNLDLEKVSSLTGVQSLLFNIICVKKAAAHKKKRETWNLQSSRSRAVNVARQLQRSKTQMSTNGQLNLRSRSLTSIKFSSKAQSSLQQNTEKLFLEILYKLVHQVHYLLEYAYILMMQAGCVQEPLTSDMFHLESILTDIHQIIDEDLVTRTNLPLLKQLQESAQKAMNQIIDRCLQVQKNILS